MNKGSKLARLDELLLDNYIELMENDGLSPIELQGIVAYLKMNKQVADKKEEETESDIIDGLIDDL